MFAGEVDNFRVADEPGRIGNATLSVGKLPDGRELAVCGRCRWNGEVFLVGGWNDMGWPAGVPLMLCVAPALAGALYVARPTARVLVTTKALSIAILSAGLGGTVFGVITLLQIIADRSPPRQ